MEFTEFLASRCPICQHPRKQEINAALQIGTACEVQSWLSDPAVLIYDLERHARHARIRSNNNELEIRRES